MSEFAIERCDDSTGVTIGVLILKNVANIPSDERLNAAKEACVQRLRERYGSLARADIKALHPMDVFSAYYRKFGYSYHVLLQFESVLKGKALPTVLTAVEAMFMAELENMMLTSGHDLSRVEFPLRLRTAREGEIYTGIGGRECASVDGDFLIEDTAGVFSTILRGPDARTRITSDTRDVLYIGYAPAGIGGETLLRHLDCLEAAVRLFSPGSQTLLKQCVQ